MREDARSGRNATDRKWLPRNLALSALVLALATITLLLRRDATQRNALASLPGEAEYGVAQAKAKILADQVYPAVNRSATPWPDFRAADYPLSWRCRPATRASSQAPNSPMQTTRR
jgi:hypothetical protein